jgi:hypothetical protein
MGLIRLSPESGSTKYLIAGSRLLTTALGLITCATGVLSLDAAKADDQSLIVVAGHPQTPPGKLAVEEMQSYFGKMFTNQVKGVELAEDPMVVLGTPASNPLVQQMIQQGKIALPQGKNADQGYAIRTVNKTIYVAASTEVGMLYGLYGLLEEYGAYFQISGDWLPDRTPFKLKQLNISVAPVFKYRGILPWDNFLCGSSGYNEEDWRALIARATRMKLNKLDLHFNPGYVYYNEVWDGKPVPPGWVAHPNDFAPQGKPGAKAFGDMKLFCVRTWEENKGNPIKQAEASQAVLRRVIDYSHECGWVVVAGFALMQPQGGDFIKTQKSGNPRSGGMNTPDPLQEKNVTLSLQRYRRLEEIYPNADYYWMWQLEGGGGLCREVGKEPGAKEMREKYAYWSDKNRAGDIDYAYLFWQVAQRLTPQERAKLATGGWDVQHLFPGIQQDFAKQIIFASLNSYNPINAVKELDNYRVARSGRRAWMIEWWEFDGDEWFPQFRTSWQEQEYKKAAEFGVESVSLLGWKLSAIEHQVRYLAEFSWNPTLSAKEFTRQFVQHIYGRTGAGQITSLYNIYDEWDVRTPPATPADDRPMLLGAGWRSLAIPEIPFSSDSLTAEKWKRVVMRAGKILEAQQQLLEQDRKSIGVMRSLLPSLTPTSQSWARLLINRLEFRCLYLQATQALNRSFITYDQFANTKGIPAGTKITQKETANALQLAAQAIEKYAEEVRNRGDLGLIGQLNVQFYDIIAQLNSRFQLDSPYLMLNRTAPQIDAKYCSDLTNPKCWPLRDGHVEVTPFDDRGTPTIRVALAGVPNAKLGSLFIRQDEIDLERQPLLDFDVRTTTKDPVALMLQIEGKAGWFELDIVGKQSYHQLDQISPALEVNDGHWHHITWNLEKLVRERVGQEVKSIKTLIIGTWSNPAKPVVVEFKNFCFGKVNKADNREVDR